SRRPERRQRHRGPSRVSLDDQAIRTAGDRAANRLRDASRYLNGASGQGTWRSAIEKLEYLSALGVNMLEGMPPAEFPGDVSWGYNPVYPFAPERVYGAPDDAKAFIDSAHAREDGRHHRSCPQSLRKRRQQHRARHVLLRRRLRGRG